VITIDVKNITKHACLDLTGDETSWGHAGYGEAGSGITGLIINKLDISKRGQAVIISDANRIRPQAYMYRYKLHEMPDDWTLKGQYEARYIIKQLTPLVEVEPTGLEVKKIFNEKFHSTWDFFTGNVIMDWIGEKGFGATMTYRRDRLIFGVPRKCFHKQKILLCAKTKVASFLQPIVAIKDYDGGGRRVFKTYKRVHCSFQSTSSYNISTVNALSKRKLYVEPRQRGSNNSKRVWGIKTNQARRTYLSNYFRIDVMDHLIKNTNLAYRS